MESIIKWVSATIQKRFAEVDLSPLPGKPHGKLRLGPTQLLAVIAPRTAIERRFAWIKRNFGLKFFQCYTLGLVTQFVLLTYIAALAVALAAERYQRPELRRCHSIVLAHL
jgi:hypothetical protein